MIISGVKKLNIFIKFILLFFVLISFAKTLDYNSWTCTTIDVHTFRQLTRYYAGMNDKITTIYEDCPDMDVGVGQEYRYKSYLSYNMIPHKIIGSISKIMQIDTPIVMALFSFILFLLNLFFMYKTVLIITKNEFISLVSVLYLLMLPFTFFSFHFFGFLNQLFIQTFYFFSLYILAWQIKKDPEKIWLYIISFIFFNIGISLVGKSSVGEWYHSLDRKYDILRYFFTLKYFVTIGIVLILKRLGLVRQD